MKTQTAESTKPTGWEMNRIDSWVKFCKRFRAIHPFVEPDFQNKEHRNLFRWYDGGIIDEVMSRTDPERCGACCLPKAVCLCKKTEPPIGGLLKPLNEKVSDGSANHQ